MGQILHSFHYMKSACMLALIDTDIDGFDIHTCKCIYVPPKLIEVYISKT